MRPEPIARREVLKRCGAGALGLGSLGTAKFGLAKFRAVARLPTSVEASRAVKGDSPQRHSINFSAEV